MSLYNEITLLNLSSELFERELLNLNDTKIVEYQKYLWDKVMEVGSDFKSDFSRQDITNYLEPSTNYMYRMGCTYPKSSCRAKICIKTNPNCARQKLIETIVALKEEYMLLTLRNSYDLIFSREK